MNSNVVIPLHPVPPLPRPPAFKPEHWLLLASSQAWQSEAQIWMLQHRDAAGPLGWRLRHGLLRIGNPQTLEQDLRSVLNQQVQSLKVLAEPGAWNVADGELDVLLARHLPADGHAMSLQLGTMPESFAEAAVLLDEADSAAAEYWLISGRSVLPRFEAMPADMDTKAGNFEADAQCAFETWAAAFAAQHDPADLDEVYGSASTFAQRMSERWVDDDGLVQQLAPGVERRPPLTRSAHSLAAASGRGSPAGHSVSGVFDVSDARGPTDRFSLLTAGCIAPGNSAGTLTVELELATARWKDQQRLVLEIHVDGFPVQLLHFGPEDRSPGTKAHTFKLSRKMNCDEAQRQALMMSVELWLTPASSTQPASDVTRAISRPGEGVSALPVAMSMAAEAIRSLVRLLDISFVKPSMPGTLAGSSAMSDAGPIREESPVFSFDWAQGETSWRMRGWKGRRVTLEQIDGPPLEPVSILWSAAGKSAEPYPLSREGHLLLVGLSAVKAMRRAEAINQARGDEERVGALLPIVRL